MGGIHFNPTQITQIRLLHIESICRQQKNVTEILKLVMKRVENIVGKQRTCWSPTFSPFPTKFSKGFFLTA